MFVDEESGVDSYLVTVGSRPGHGDVMQGQKVTADCQEFHTDVSMTNGHSYYVTVGVSDDEAIDEAGGGKGGGRGRGVVHDDNVRGDTACGHNLAVNICLSRTISKKHTDG